MSLTLKQILDSNYLGNAIIVGGHTGLDREVRMVNVMEVPDIFDWVSPDELILTTGYPFKDAPKDMAELIIKLNDKGVAGMAVKPNRFIKELPEEIIRLADKLGFPLFTLPHNAQFDKIILEVFTKIINEDYHIIKKAHEIHETLTELVLEGADFPGISQALANLCFGEIILKDAFGHVLAQAKPAASSPQSGNANINISNIFEKEVRLSKQIIAYITLRSWRNTIENVDLVAIDFTATIIAMKMFKIETSKEKEKRRRNEFLNNLLFDRIQSAEQAVHEGKSYGIDLNIPYIAAIVNIDFPNKVLEPNNENDIFDNLDRLIYNSPLPDRDKYICWNNSDVIVILSPVKRNCNNNIDNTIQIASEIKSSLIKLLPGAAVTIGIGRYHPGILAIGKSYREAQMAAGTGELVWGSNGIYHYNDLGVYQLLSQFAGKEQANDFIENILSSLIEYDTKKNSQLLLTLEQLLTGDNIKNIAEKLYIHPKTISFRKQRIEEILDLNLEDPEKRLSLSIALKLYRLGNATEKPMNKSIKFSPIP
jgi:purine catabolism regulator